ncbi:MAG TPA: bifunctional phosphoribosylaminoimidazolecarboxamide formyltransferase/IMP cyclohydrolase [Acidimicrobiales bacterium]|nr:bifunctional phosphoribosylaminoimidazolecarboxamide formyltransferase/IMP cyclohydrolase [Acidimicrobiales bacterium]
MVRALLSVHDKTGIAALARGLRSLGWELIASGNTSRLLTEEGIDHVDVATVTGSPEMLGGRVKTLHPKIHGGILADRSKPEHLADLVANGIVAIDLVVSNLYPFRAEPSVEMIDIGGPTMVRAAAKNHGHVGILVNPEDYGPVLDEIRLDGKLSEATRKRLARAAFAHTAAYDAAIVDWFDDDEALPPTIHLALERVQELRYGENPHQEGARYRAIGGSSFWDDIEVHGAMALSYLNLYDAEAAWRLAYDLGDGPVAVIVKHANPCGVGVASSLSDAYRLAFECDERSAFGGIVAVNQILDAATVDAMVEAAQADVVIAPSYADGVIEALARKRRNTRVITAAPPVSAARDYRQIDGGFLVQEAHHFESVRDAWRVVTKRAPTEAEWTDAELAWRICGHVKSNAIVLVKSGQAVGIGAGQQNRVESGLIASTKAAGRAKGGACASDAFYPFPDGVEAAAESGAAVVVQPGGALHDDEVIARADELGLAMVFTGERHFLH